MNELVESLLRHHPPDISKQCTSCMSGETNARGKAYTDIDDEHDPELSCDGVSY